MDMNKEIVVRSIKILDIGYITVLYMIFSLSCAALTDRIMGKFDPVREAKKSKVQLVIELILVVWMYGILVYAVRNIVGYIPFPLNGVSGFDHSRVKELSSATVFTFTYVLFSDYIKNKITFFYKNMK